MAYGEDGQKDQSIIFSTKEHSKPHPVDEPGKVSGVDIDQAETLRSMILYKFPDLDVTVSVMGPWSIVTVSDGFVHPSHAQKEVKD